WRGTQGASSGWSSVRVSLGHGEGSFWIFGVAGRFGRTVVLAGDDDAVVAGADEPDVLVAAPRCVLGGRKVGDRAQRQRDGADLGRVDHRLALLRVEFERGDGVALEGLVGRFGIWRRAGGTGLAQPQV